MSDVTFALAIPHTPWVEARRISMMRLAEELDHTNCENVVDVHVFSDREPNRVWAQKLWRWALSTSATHLLQLQDDVEPSPEFWARLHAMVSANPNMLIGLHAAHPAGPDLAQRGDRWYATQGWLVGVGYVFPWALLESFIAWCDANPSEVANRNEDDLISFWAHQSKTLVWHPIPTLIDHDIAVESTYSNDLHAHRRPTVTWRDGSWTSEQLASVEFWRPSHKTRILPNPHSEEHTRALRSDARRRYHARFANETPVASLMVAAVNRGRVSAAFNASVVQLMRAIELEADLVEVSDYRMWDADVVRVRNRVVQYFLAQRDETHLLFVDADIEFSPTCVMGMVAAKKGMVAAPYPKRMGVDWEAVARGFLDGDEAPPEARAYKYPVLGYSEKSEFDEANTCLIDGIGFGLVLLEREALIDFYAHTMQSELYLDRPWQLRPTQELIADCFGLLNGPDGGRLSEDHSFCQRWRKQGRAVSMYLGHGSPVSHWGEARHGGCIEAFGLRRETK